MEEFESDIREFFVGRQGGFGERFDAEQNPGSVSLKTLEKIWRLATMNGGAPRSFLDVGSGFGLPLAFFATRVEKCVGIELNPRVAHDCRLRLEKLGAKNCEVIVGDAREVDLRKLVDEADLVFCNDLLFEDEASAFLRETLFASFAESPRSRRGWAFTGRPLVAHARMAWDEPRWDVPSHANLKIPRLAKTLSRTTKISVAHGRLWGGEGDHFSREMIVFGVQFCGAGVEAPRLTGPDRLRLLELCLDFPRVYGRLRDFAGEHKGAPQRPDDLFLAETREEAEAARPSGCLVLSPWSDDPQAEPAIRVTYSAVDCDLDWMYPADGTACAIGFARNLYLH